VGAGVGVGGEAAPGLSGTESTVTKKDG